MVSVKCSFHELDKSGNFTFDTCRKARNLSQVIRGQRKSFLLVDYISNLIRVVITLSI